MLLAGERGQRNGRQTSRCVSPRPEETHQIKSVLHGHRQVTDQDVRPILIDRRQRFGHISDVDRLRTGFGYQALQPESTILVVVDNQHTQTLQVDRLGVCWVRSDRTTHSGAGARQWKRDREDRPFPYSFAVRLHRPAVKKRDVFHDRQSQTKATVNAS
jgi:hypothetical protein